MVGLHGRVCAARASSCYFTDTGGVEKRPSLLPTLPTRLLPPGLLTSRTHITSNRLTSLPFYPPPSSHPSTHLSYHTSHHAV